MDRIGSGPTPSSAPGQRPYVADGQVITRSQRPAQNPSWQLSGASPPAWLSRDIPLFQLYTTYLLRTHFPLVVLSCTSHLPGHFCQQSGHLALSHSCPDSLSAKAVVSMPASPIQDQALNPHLDRHLSFGNYSLYLGFLFWFLLIFLTLYCAFHLWPPTIHPAALQGITIFIWYEGTWRLRKVKWPIWTSKW